MTITNSEAGARHIGLVLFDEVEELDAVGPWEVLAFWTLQYPSDGWTISTASHDGAPVTGAKGLVIGAHHSFENAPQYEILIHPGGAGTRPLVAAPAYLEWIRERRQTAEIMASVCTGALVLGAAGLLHDRPATTYWDAFEELHSTDPTIELRREERWVDDGDVMTSAGVSAGIDMALHLVARLAGVERAREVKRGIEYSPAPPV